MLALALMDLMNDHTIAAKTIAQTVKAIQYHWAPIQEMIGTPSTLPTFVLATEYMPSGKTMLHSPAEYPKGMR